MRIAYLDLGENAEIVITDINGKEYHSKLYVYYADIKELKLTIDMISSVKIKKIEGNYEFLSLLE